MDMQNLTLEDLEKGVDLLAEMDADEAPQLLALKSEIAKSLYADLNGLMRAPGDDPLAGLSYLAPPQDLEADFDEPLVLSASRCTKAIIATVVRAAMLILDLYGLRARLKTKKAIESGMKSQVPEKAFNGFQTLIEKLSTASGAKDKGLAFYNLMQGMDNLNIIKIVTKSAKQDMNFREWVKFGLLFGLQVSAWFLSGGIAFAAQVGLTVVSAVELGKSANEVRTCC